jgi:two-component system cell cycle sensor histidine kinase/response regulator CckA
MKTHQDARILIIDDQDFNTRLLERILKQAGYRDYRSLNDSRQAIAAYQEFQPDLVLLDLMMPHLDGLAVLEQLRLLTKDTYLPVLVLTADVTPEARRRALSAGAKDFLTKPLDAVEVLLRTKNLLETRFFYQGCQEQADQRVQDLAALLDQASDAIIVQDLDEHVLYWNKSAERLYGWTAEEVLGKDIRPLLCNGLATNLLAVSQAVFNSGKWSGELGQISRDGREFTVASRWTLICDEQGRPKSRLIINSKVIEKEVSESELHRISSF